MATVTKWSNVAVAMQSALAAADTITGITKASPGVATSTAHGLNNGDYVYLSINGMHQLNDRVVRVANVAANTFELEGIDTTSFDTFTSGTAEAVTFGTSITTATTVSSDGGGFDLIDTTTIHVSMDVIFTEEGQVDHAELSMVWKIGYSTAEGAPSTFI